MRFGIVIAILIDFLLLVCDFDVLYFGVPIKYTSFRMIIEEKLPYCPYNVNIFLILNRENRTVNYFMMKKLIKTHIFR